VLRCLGQQSKVYRNARKSRLDPFQQFVSAISRSMVAEAGFRGTLGGAWHGGMAELEGLSHVHLFLHLRDVCRDELKSGVMQEAQLQQVALAAVHQLGTTETGTVSCAQFVRACMANDSVSLEDVARVVTEYQRFSQEKIQDVQLDDPESGTASSAIVSNQRKEWEADVAHRLTLLEELVSGKSFEKKAEGNTSAMGLLSQLHSRLQDKLESCSSTSQKDELAREPSTCSLASQVLSLHEQFMQTDERLKRVELQTDATDGASQFPSGVLHKLDQQMMELRQDCERRIRALEHHLRVSPVQETPVKHKRHGFKMDGIGNSKLLEESLKANSAGHAGAGSACSTARGTSSTAMYEVQSRLNSIGSTIAGSTMDDLQSVSTTVRGYSACESSAVINDEDLNEILGQEEKAEACQGSLSSQGIDHIQVWYPFERSGDRPRAPGAPAAVHLKENQRKLPSPIPSFDIEVASEEADLRVRTRKVNHPTVPAPPARPSFHDPGQPTRSLVPPIPMTKMKAPRETSKDSPKGSPRESELLRRRQKFGKAELGVECKRYLPAPAPGPGKPRSHTQPPAAASHAARERSGHAALAATMTGGGYLRA